MPAYPNTLLTEGLVDPAFGGQQANRFGTPQHTFQDAQIRELQAQTVANTWAGRPVQNWAIQSSGIAGDAIVFDWTMSVLNGGWSYRTLVATGYVQDQTPIVAVLLEPVASGGVAMVCTGGGVIAPAITGLTGASAGPITIDQTTGRLRTRSTGETTFGFCDPQGNCHLFPIPVN